MILSSCNAPSKNEEEVQVGIVNPQIQRAPAFQFDPEFDHPEPEWPDEETKQRVEKECTDLIKGSKQAALCPDLPMDDAIATCIDDAKVCA